MIFGRRRRTRAIRAVLTVMFVAGAAILLYPGVANAWNTMYQRHLIQNYEKYRTEAAADGSLSYELEFEKALAYNNGLWPTRDPEGFIFLNEDEPEPEYMDCLNVNGDGVMGYISIPKIDIEIPIYHSTDERALLKGAGHLEGTSLPVGGPSTHSVIAAHRGLPGADLFTDLDKMEAGDHFFIHVLDEELAYEVDQILVVDPEDVSALVIREGEDLCTLLTCTPYGVNSQRLLVRGHRVYMSEDETDESADPEMRIQDWMALGGLAAAAAGIVIMIRGGRRKRNVYPYG